MASIRTRDGDIRLCELSAQLIPIGDEPCLLGGPLAQRAGGRDALPAVRHRGLAGLLPPGAERAGNRCQRARFEDEQPGVGRRRERSIDERSDDRQRAVGGDVIAGLLSRAHPGRKCRRRRCLLGGKSRARRQAPGGRGLSRRSRLLGWIWPDPAETRERDAWLAGLLGWLWPTPLHDQRLVRRRQGLMALLFGCFRPDSAAVTLDPDSFEQKLSTTPDRYLIDVRTLEEHREVPVET